MSISRTTQSRPITCVFGRICLASAFLTAGPGAARALAHDFTIADVAALLKTDGTYLIDMTLDLDALALGLPPGPHGDAPAEALRAMSPAERDNVASRLRDLLHRRIRVVFDDAPGERIDVSFPQAGSEVIVIAGSEPSYFGITARLSGAIPENAAVFTFRASRAFGPVRLTVFDQRGGSAAQHMLAPGEPGPPWTIGESGTHGTSAAAVAWQYLALGFSHILPKGLDHILFVLGLFLLSVRLRPLLWQITAFTVAHSITLALSVCGVMALSERIVEPLIGLSIAYVAVENVVTSKLTPWRPVVVFVFGLLHGLGFAGVLMELGLPQDRFVTALIAFNVGVEVGQIAVVAMAFAAVGWLRHKPWYRKRIAIPASVAVGLAGGYWFFERALGG